MVNGTKFGSQFWLMNKNWPSKLVNGTKDGCQNMFNGTKFVLQNWLAEQKMSFKIG